VGELEVVEGYRFGEKDSDDNIVFAKEGAENVSAVKGGTIAKLIERLTHDKYPGIQKCRHCSIEQVKH